MEDVQDRMIILRDEILRYHFEYYLGFRKNPDAHLPHIDYRPEEEKQADEIRKSPAKVNKNSPNEKKSSNPHEKKSPNPREKKSPSKDDEKSNFFNFTV